MSGEEQRRPGSARSITVASIREPTPAVSNASTTASGVTMPGSPSLIDSPAGRTVRYRRWTSTGSWPPTAPIWDRLAAPVRRRPGAASRRLDTAELDELVRLYQRASAHLSYARTYFADPALTARLTNLVGRADALVYGTRPRSWRGRRPLLHRDVPRRGVGTAVVRGREQRRCSSCPRWSSACGWPTPPRPSTRPAPAALRQAYLNHDFAVLLLVAAVGAVRRPGPDQQHPGGVPRLRRRHRRVRPDRSCCCHQRGRRRARRPACSPPPASRPSSRADPAPRAARADLGRDRRRRRAAPRVGADRTRRPVPRRGPRRGGPAPPSPIVGRADRHLHRRRDHRGVRHRLGAADRGAGGHRRSASRRRSSPTSSPRSAHSRPVALTRR